MAGQKRVHYLDIARGIAVIAVVIGHIQPSLCPEWLTAWVYSFHLPLFFIISGILVNTKKYDSFGSFFKKTAKKLFVQYLILSLAVFAIDIAKDLFKHNFDLVPAAKQFSGILISWRHTEFYNALWFIPATILSEFIAYPIIKKTGSLTKKQGQVSLAIAAAFMAIAGCTVRFALGTQTLPWSADISLVIVAFILFGQLLRPLVFEKTISLSNAKKVALISICLLINISTCIFNCAIIGGRSDLYDCIIGNPLLLYSSAISGTLAIILLSSIANKSSLLERIGSRSLVFYAFQTLALPIAKSPVVFSQNKLNIQLDKLVCAIVVTLLTCILLNIVAVIAELLLPKIFPRIEKASIHKLKIGRSNQ